MIRTADSDRRKLWPCRPPAGMRKNLEMIQGIENLSKTGVINLILGMGIEWWQRGYRERQAILGSGLSIGDILPFLGYGGDPADKDRVEAAKEHFRKYPIQGIRQRIG